MSQENVETIRRAYDVFNQGGPEAVINAGIWSPEIVFDFSPSEIPGLGVYRGHDEVRAFFEEDCFGAFPFGGWEVVLDELVDPDPVESRGASSTSHETSCASGLRHAVYRWADSFPSKQPRGSQVLLSCSAAYGRWSSPSFPTSRHT